MDNDRLRTDISYKEGYVEGRKESLSVIMTHLQKLMDNLKSEIEYDELLLENINKSKKI